MPEWVAPLPWPLQRARSGGERLAAWSIKRHTKETEEIGRLLYPERFGRPRTRADCVDLPRPCPFVGCKYNLFMDVNQDTGTIRWNYLGEPWEMAHSCALDIADQGGTELERISEAIGMSRERVRQIETVALERIAALDDDYEEPRERGRTAWERMGGV